VHHFVQNVAANEASQHVQRVLRRFSRQAAVAKNVQHEGVQVVMRFAPLGTVRRCRPESLDSAGRPLFAAVGRARGTYQCHRAHLAAAVPDNLLAPVRRISSTVSRLSPVHASISAAKSFASFLSQEIESIWSTVEVFGCSESPFRRGAEFACVVISFQPIHRVKTGCAGATQRPADTVAVVDNTAIALSDAQRA
jgi:hypothetical protein